MLEHASAGWSALTAIRTAYGARTSLLVPERDRLFVAERAGLFGSETRDPRLSAGIMIEAIGDVLRSASPDARRLDTKMSTMKNKSTLQSDKSVIININDPNDLEPDGPGEPAIGRRFSIPHVHYGPFELCGFSVLVLVGNDPGATARALLHGVARGCIF